MPVSRIPPLPGMVYSWPTNERGRCLSVVLCVRRNTTVNVVTGQARSERCVVLAKDATYDLTCSELQWSNLTYIDPDFDEAFIDIE